MIIIRSPLRITFGGGSTDLPSFALQHEGFCISAAISRYVYVAINHTFAPGIILKYSDMETPQKAEDIRHPIFREALQEINLQTPQVEIISMADVPSDGAGLGNSGAFTVALLKALYSYKNIPVSPEYVAERACNINMVKLGKVQGKQDEYISAFGGITCLEFKRDGTVGHYPLKISHSTLIDLEENLMLFYTNIKHDTQEILSYQDNKTKESNSDIIKNLQELKGIGDLARRMLEHGDTEGFAHLLNLQWENKERRMPYKNNLLKNIHYDLLTNGAVGSKIIGSGNGGFIMVYASNKALVRNYMQGEGMEELRFTFDFDGCKRLI